MSPLLFPVLFLSAMALLILLNHLALHEWRRAAGQHWSERARVLYPARVGSIWAQWLIPVIVVLVRRDYWPQLGRSHAMEWIIAYLGAWAGTWWMTRSISPTVTLRIWFYEGVTGMILTATRYGFFLWVAVTMPRHAGDPGVTAAAMKVGGYLLFDLWLSTGGLLRLFRVLGWLPDAPERVQRLATAVAQETGQSLPPLWTCESTVCNAYAAPWPRVLLFTQPMLDRLNDAELTSVIRHEMAHLSENRWLPILRLSGLLGTWPWLFIAPLMLHFGFPALVALYLWRWGIQRALQRLSQRLEKRADQFSVGSTPEDGAVYAQALAAIYEANAIPASGFAGGSHPNLYDRMLAAGVTPDFPRPAAPYRTGGLTVLLWLGVIAALGPHFIWLLDALPFGD